MGVQGGSEYGGDSGWRWWGLAATSEVPETIARHTSLLSLAARRLSQHLVRCDAGVHTPKRVAQRKDDAGRDQARGRRARLARLLLRVEEGLHVRVQSKVLRSKINTASRVRWPLCREEF